MRAYVDQVNSGQAMLLLGEDESVTVTIPVAWLPGGIREGDVLQLVFRRDKASTQQARKQVAAALEGLADEP